MRILAVAQRLDLLERDRQDRRKCVGRPGQAGLVREVDAGGRHPRRQLRRDPGVVGRGVAERLDCQGSPQAVGHAAAVGDRGEDRGIAIGRRHDRQAGLVLRRGADHRRPADVDLLDELVERDPGSLGGGGERVEVHHDELERSDRCRCQLAAMIDEPPIGEDAGVDPGMERLDPPVEHLRRTRYRRDVRHGQARVAERAGGAAGRDELEAGRDEASSEVDEPGLVRHGQERSTRNRDGRLRSVDVEADGPLTVRRRGDSARQQERHRAGQQPMLDRLDPLVERGLVVVRQDLDRLLGDDRAPVERRVDQVDGRAADLRAVCQRIPARTRPGKRG